jgi:D-sedoheptulose 7-phosphate isomerase
VSDLVEKVRRASEETMRTQRTFFDTNVEAIVRCAQAVARALDEGGRLYTFGNGGSACDAQHVAVEFSHPVFEKRRAFPAIALPNDVARVTAVGNDRDFALVFADALRVHARAGDVAFGFSTSGNAASVVRGLSTARELGMLTVGFTGRDGGRVRSACEHAFVVESFSIHRIQETHQTLLHVLWDLVHVVRGEEDVLT